MNWQQIVMIVFVVIDLFIIIARSGKPKEGYYNFWSDFIALALELIILYTGGFWKQM